MANSFNPLTQQFEDSVESGTGINSMWQPDCRDGSVYVYDEELFLATQVALATGRPLLLQGEPGCGKSSYAAFVARNLKYRYYEAVVTSETSVRDLLWNFDLVRRLADAQASRGSTFLRDLDYLEPGPLWWLFDRDSALRRGWSDEAGNGSKPAETREPFAEINAARRPDAGVLLIDEIDKADPDLPNALLVPLGSLQFEVTDVRSRVVLVRHVSAAGGGAVGDRQASRVLVIVTTNEERDLPAAFMRRCIVHRLRFPSNASDLLKIAQLHFRGDRRYEERRDALAMQLAGKVLDIREEAARERGYQPGTAEYLDALRACLSLGIKPDKKDTNWEWLRDATLCKRSGSAD